MRTKLTSRHILSFVLALILCAIPVLSLAQDATDSVAVSDQESDGTSVTITDVTAAVAGWIVIHLDSNGGPGPVIGYSAVDAGVNSAVAVNLDPALEADTALWAMLHVDAGVIGEYEFPGPDGPVRDGDMIVMTPFTAMVAVTDAADEEAADEEAADEEAADEEAADEEAADEEAADEEAADEEAADEEVADEEVADEELADIVDTAVAAGSFTTLVAAVQAANLVDALKGDGPFTVFAPTDDAFAALPAGTIDALLADPSGDLTQILLYHVIAGEVLAADVTDGLEAVTLQGGAVTFTVDGGGVKINDANIIATDILASNGVIHVIDAVILPAADEDAAEEEMADDEVVEEEEMDEGDAPELLPVTGAGLAGAAAQAIPAALAVAGALAGGFWVSRRRRS